MQVCDKHGWNFFHTTGFFFLMVLILLCATCQANSDPCIYKIDSPAPRCDVDRSMVVERGLPVQLKCSTSWVEGEASVRDLEILINNEPAEPNRVTVQNEYTISYSLNNLPLPKFIYTCRLKLKNNDHKQNTILRQFTVIIAERPKKPSNFKCVSPNWETVECTFEPAPNYIETRFFLRPEPPGLVLVEQSNCFVYPPADKPLKHSCTWSATTNPSYRLTHRKYQFVLEAENSLGNDRFSWEFDDWAHVVPSKPVNLSVLNVTANNALLHWAVPLPMQNFPPGLHYRISYQSFSLSGGSQIQRFQQFQPVDITNDTHAKEIHLNLNNLEPNTVYTVKVSIKSAVAVDENMWSQFSEVTFKTPEKHLRPRSDVGSFEVVGNSDNRDVYIYWQTIPPFPENEDDISYKVVRVEEGGRKSDIRPDEITKSYAKFTGIGLNSVRFDIAPANEADNSIATVRVPSQFEIPPKPVVFTKIAFGKGVYELSWNPSSGQDITNYTIFWCESVRDRPYQCSGDLDWTHVPGSTNMYNVTVPWPEKVYQFAIAANTRQASSGMVWFSGITTLSKDVGRVKSVRLNRVESNEIEIGAEVDYSGRIGTVKGLNMYYCLKLSPHNCNGSKLNKTVTAIPRPTYTQGFINGLRPESTYMLEVALLTEDGEGPLSEPIYFTTSEAKLDLTTETPEVFSPETTEVPVDTIVRYVLEETLSGVESSIQKILETRDQTLLSKLNGIDEIISKIIDFETQVSNLTLTISEFEDKFDSLSKENCRLNQKLEECQDNLSRCKNSPRAS